LFYLSLNLFDVFSLFFSTFPQFFVFLRLIFLSTVFPLDCFDTVFTFLFFSYPDLCFSPPEFPLILSFACFDCYFFSSLVFFV